MPIKATRKKWMSPLRNIPKFVIVKDLLSDKPMVEDPDTGHTYSVTGKELVEYYHIALVGRIDGTPRSNLDSP